MSKKLVPEMDEAQRAEHIRDLAQQIIDKVGRGNGEADLVFACLLAAKCVCEGSKDQLMPLYFAPRLANSASALGLLALQRATTLADTSALMRLN